MKIIIVTGKSGSGKTSVAKMLSLRLGAKLLSLDEISHQSLSDTKIKNELIELFGRSILTDNSIDRKKLGRVAFNDQKKLEVLNQLSWEFIDNEVDKFLNSCKSEFVVLDYALLPKMKYFDLAYKKILVKANRSIRFARLTTRDNVGSDYLSLRDKNGITYHDSDFDFIFENNFDSLQKLELAVDFLAKKIQI